MIIAQITDTHIKADGKLAYRKVDSAKALRDCVDHVNELVPRPDAVIMTGDLADVGRPSEYAAFRKIADRLAMPFFVIPGNHDERGAFRDAFADQAYLQRCGDFLQYAIEDYPIRLVGLDTTVPGEPFGMMCDARLAWLDDCLRQAPDRPTLVFMHHPPFLTGIEHMDVQNCRNDDALGAVLARHPQVRQLTCGHIHRPIQLNWHGLTASIGPSPSHSVALDLRPKGPSAFVLDPPACQIFYEAGDGNLVGHLSFIGNFDGPHPFFDASGAIIE